jgi:hypothetical protein
VLGYGCPAPSLASRDPSAGFRQWSPEGRDGTCGTTAARPCGLTSLPHGGLSRGFAAAVVSGGTADQAGRGAALGSGHVPQAWRLPVGPGPGRGMHDADDVLFGRAERDDKMVRFWSHICLLRPLRDGRQTPRGDRLVLRPRLTALHPAGAVGVTAEYTSNEVLPSERQTRSKCYVLGSGGNAAPATTHVTSVPVTRRSGR